MTPIPDLVKLSKLETQFHSDPEYTQHVHDVCGNTPRQRSVRKEERWKRERRLGRGSFGDVWLEQCIQGDSEGKVRAVKEVQKLEFVDYHRELEAIALFSYEKYKRCFVKSFGWYENSDSIFITMEYLPNGDLHQCINSSLPEDDGQNIVFQILEGLDFMHDNGFVHRDLKPANILVLCKGPDWWVKIADFGISKRAIEGLTAFRTLTGTPAFTAPEILGFLQPGDRSHDTYTNAVDIWSLGVITYLILTGETLFKDQRHLDQYVAGSFKFPSGVLLANKVSGRGCDFVRRLMAPKSEDRPGAKKCLQHPWLGCLLEGAAPENQRTINISKSMPTLLNDSDSEPSASWSTQDPISVYKIHSSTSVFTGKTISASDEAIALSTSESATQSHWHITSKLKGHSSWVKAVIFSPDGKQIASGSSDKTVRLWDPAIGTTNNVLEGHSKGVMAVVFSPDGKQLASGSDDMTIRLWNPAIGTTTNILKGHSKGITAMVFSPDGKQIASGSDDMTIRLWDPATGTTNNILKGPLYGIRTIAFSPDGKQIASGSWNWTIRLWDPATGTIKNVLKGISVMSEMKNVLMDNFRSVMAVAFSPDGKQIASGSETAVVLWDSATGVMEDNKDDKVSKYRKMFFT